MNSGRATRAAWAWRRHPPALALLAAGAVGLGASCATRDLSVEITAAGADTLVSACEYFSGICDPDICHQNSLCDQQTCTLVNACTVPGNPPWTPQVTLGMRLLVLDASPTSLDIKTASACVPLNLRPCIQDPSNRNGCPCIIDPLGPTTCTPDTTGAAEFACIRDTFAEAVSGAMGSGLTFSGFTSTDGVSLAAALYVKPGDEAECYQTVLVNPSDCATENLTAVAGIGQASGSTTFDITCASCQGGTHDAYGTDNAPCPVTTDACFLQRVASALASSNL